MNGWGIARHGRDRAQDRTQRQLNHAGAAGGPDGETPPRSAKDLLFSRTDCVPAVCPLRQKRGDARPRPGVDGQRPSRLGRRPGGSGGDQGGVGDADARGVLDRPYHGLPDHYVDRLGLGPLAAHVDERSLLQPG